MQITRSWLDKVDQDTLVLTVNRRLARTLTQRLDQEWLSSGERVWPTPQILPLSTWQEQCWDQLLDQLLGPLSDHLSPDALSDGCHAPTLLTAWQERLLWEKIIESHTGEALLRVFEAAHNAQNAWKQLQAWQTELTEADLYGHEDAQAFHLWSIQFEAACQQENWLDHARLPGYLVQHLDKLSLPKRIFLAGFQRESPSHHAFFGAMAKAGVLIETMETVLPSERDAIHGSEAERDKSPTKGDVRVAFASVEAEILAAAQWSRTRLTSHKKTKIGIVAPALEGILPKVVEIFSRVFYPGKNPATLDPSTQSFNLSLGIRLAETPLVRDALRLLELGKGELSLEQYTALLHTPFWHGGQSEWPKRSLLDARLRKKGFLRMTPAQLRDEARRGEKESPSCPRLATTLSQFITALNAAFHAAPDSNPNADKETRYTGKNRGKERPSAWVARFSQWLSLLGWPGERGLTSGEYQNMEAWHKALASFSTLDKMVEPLSIESALAHLKRLVAEISFQPESGDAPLQILGLLESVGESFDHLWIMGLSEDVWPPPMEPNPFLPIAMQRRHGMPKSSFDLETAYYNRLFDELIHASKQVIVSYPTQNGDQPLRPSPLILSMPKLCVEGDPCAGSVAKALDFSLFPEYNQAIFAASQMTAQVDDRGPMFQVEHGVSTGVLKSQALCPFQAFARFRLGATTQREPSMGLNPSQRGQIVHSTLTHLWQNIEKSQTDLETLCVAPDPCIKTSVKETLDQKAQQWPDVLHPFFRTLEEARLERLLHSFLAMENGRDLPFTVANQEEDGQLRLGKLIVQVRMDRIDRLQDGSLVVLDYKTGAVHLKEWFGARPADPQLPLYALAQKQPIAALAFCQVRAAGCGFHGLACQDGVLPRVHHWQKSSFAAEFNDWPSLKEYWRTVLTALGDAFVQGEANMDPLPGACTYCDLHALCRYDESSGSA